VGGFDNDDVELEEFDGVGGVVIVSGDEWPELVRPYHIAQRADAYEASRVVDKLARNLDIFARFPDVVDGTIVVFTLALEGDASVFRRSLDDVAARLTRGDEAACEATFFAGATLAWPAPWTWCPTGGSGAPHLCENHGQDLCWRWQRAR
jgi:hypothetical protein